MGEIVPLETPKDWTKLARSRSGQPKPTVANVLRVFTEHPAWDGVLAYDEFRQELVTLRVPPCRPNDVPRVRKPGVWTDEDTTRTQAWLSECTGVDATMQTVESSASAAGFRHPFHPVRNYLEGLSWDGVPRIDTWISEYLHAPQDRYTNAVGSRWLISAVARVMDPGCQADHMLVLESSAQGIGKSTALKILAGPDWFSDTGLDLSNKDSLVALRAKWIYEFSELDSLRGREVTRVRAFISSSSDNYRPPYGRRNRDFLRQCVFAGTTNDSCYLTDPAGNRRFWPVKCPNIPVERDRLSRDRDQLWAEATHRYRCGEAWHLFEPDLIELAKGQQEAREVVDPMLGRVAKWLSEANRASRGVTTLDIILSPGPMGIEISQVGRSHEMRAAQMLRACGFTDRRRVLVAQGVRAVIFYKPSLDEDEI